MEDNIKIYAKHVMSVSSRMVRLRLELLVREGEQGIFCTCFLEMFSNALAHRLFEGSSRFCLDPSDDQRNSKPQFKTGYDRFLANPLP